MKLFESWNKLNSIFGTQLVYYTYDFLLLIMWSSKVNYEKNYSNSLQVENEHWVP